MRKINYLAIVLFMIVLSCGKDNPQPTTPIVTTTTSSGSSTTSTTSTTTTKKDCEINHQGTLKIVNTSSSDFYVYIEDIYVVTSKANTWVTYNKVPAHSGLSVNVIDINDYSDVRTVDMPFYDCTTTQVNID